MKPLRKGERRDLLFEFRKELQEERQLLWIACRAPRRTTHSYGFQDAEAGTRSDHKLILQLGTGWSKAAVQHAFSSISETSRKDAGLPAPIPKT